VAQPALTVVKIGGSLFGAADLSNCLDVLAASRTPVAVVPGGGPFAETVRLAQREFAFPDAEAHCMAILAMAQFGHLIAAQHERFCLVHSPSAARNAVADDAIPVWAPVDLAVKRDLVPESWDMTSDSLAAWFATMIGAQRLVLVKSAPHDPSLRPAETCVSSGLVDALFPRQIASARFEAFWIGDGDAVRLAAFLNGAVASAVAIAA
jgi:5-(aminomethyl)-3-furanmethanol phosphate kinase